MKTLTLNTLITITATDRNIGGRLNMVFNNKAIFGKRDWRNSQGSKVDVES